MLKLSARAALLALAACARQEPPPGGPPDVAPPQIVQIRPESGAVVPQMRGEAAIRFDEVIEEMAGAGGAGGAGGLERLVLLSPVAGAVRVSWARTGIEVRPREGWKPGRVYRLELRPGITDLRRNVLREGRVILFSTGPPIPNTELAGTVLQWVEQRAAPAALVLAAPAGDSLAYTTLADSAGAFTLGGVPPGRYRVFALVDQNQNGVRDRREPYDSTLVTIDSVARIVLWTFTHDSVGPRLRTADFLDSVTVRLAFSQPLDPASRIDTARVAVLALPDSTAVAVRAVMRQVEFDSLVARERAAADSARRAAAPDTGRAARSATDTTRPPRPPRPSRPAPPPRGEPAGIRPGALPPTAAGDTAALRALLARRPVPTDRLVVRLAQPLVPGAKYVVRVRGARNLNGATADAQAVLSVPARPQPRDTTARRP